MEVYECKHCDMVSVDAEVMYSHLEESHYHKKPHSRGRPPNSRSLGMDGFLNSSFQKTVYQPEVFLDEGSPNAPDTYTAYACTLCHYQHLSNQQVRRHGTMCHFLEIPVFSCVYCTTAVANRAMFDKHLQLKHGSKKVDFSFDCKALTLLNDFLSESIYQIHVLAAGLLKVIKDREMNFVHYADEVLKIMHGEEPAEAEDGGCGSQQRTEQDNCGSSNGQSLQFTEENVAKGMPNTVRSILDSMMQYKNGGKKRFLKMAVKEMLMQSCREAIDSNIKQKVVEDANEAEEESGNDVKKAGVSDGSRVVPVGLLKNIYGSDDGKEDIKMDIDVVIVKTEMKELPLENEEREGNDARNDQVEATENIVTPKRKRGRPRKKTLVQDKAYRPIAFVGASKTEKNILPEAMSEEPTEPNTILSPKRYNFRQRRKAKSFSDEEDEDKSEEEDENDDSKKSKLISEKCTQVLSEQQKIFAKSFQKILPISTSSNKIDGKPGDETKPKSVTETKQTALISALSQPVPVRLPLSVVAPIASQIKKPQSYLVVNGQLVPIMEAQASGSSAINLPQPLQFMNATGPHPTTFQSPQIIQLPPQQVQQQLPIRFNIQQPQQTFVLNLGQQQQGQQQAQIFPVLNQQIQQPQLIIQQGGELQQSSQPIQVIQSPNNATIIPAVSAPQFPIIMRQGTPSIQQQVLPQTSIQNILNLGGQFINSTQQQTMLKSQPTPFVVASTASASGTNLLPSVPQVQPIVIEPKDDLSMTEGSSKVSSLSAMDDETPSPIISHYFIGCYICRRCLQVFLTSENLDKHIYKEELDKNPMLAMPFSKMKNCLGQFAITPLVTVLQRGFEWDIPVYRCSECNIVHILESYLKDHIEEHKKEGTKCIRESLWAPSDLRVICTRGWTKSLKMQCKAQPVWAVDYFMASKADFHKQQPRNVKLKKARIGDLEMYDTIAKAENIAQKQKSPKPFKLVTIPQSVPQPASSQSAAITVHSGMQGSVTGPALNPVQILPLQNVVQPRPVRTPQLAQRFATQLIPGARIIQVPQVLPMVQKQQQPQPAAPQPIQVMLEGQPTSSAQPVHLIQQLQNPSTSLNTDKSNDSPEMDRQSKPEVEKVEPDSSCQVEEEDEKAKSPESNLLLAPNILSCFSEGEEGEARLEGKFLEKIPADDTDMTDTGAGEVDESENQTGEAFACRLCAYSCDTDRRIKQHLMSSHISANMYPFRCVSCSYESPSTLRLAQHILYKHQKQAKKNPPRLAKDMEKDKELWPKIMPNENKYKRFTQELDCLFRNCVEKC